MSFSNSANDMAYFWKKKEFVSYMLCVLVFFIHISSFKQYPVSGDFISVVNEKTAFFLQVSINSFAVPTFFMLSGVAFFRDYNNSCYVSKVKSRLFTLVIPYLLWNTAWMLFDIVCSYTPISNYFAGREPFELSVVNILKGVFLYKSNLPFWFIFCLIIFVLLSPVIDLLVKNKHVGIVSICAVAVVCAFFVPRPTEMFYDRCSIVYYMVGAFIGKHFLESFTKKSDKRIQISSLAFLVTYIVLKNLFPDNQYFLKPLVAVVCLVISSIALWNVTDIFMHKVKPVPAHSRSFAVYALHLNVSAIITKVFILLFGQKEILALPNFIFTVICTLTFINIACYFLEKFVPTVYNVFMGKYKKTA